VQLFNTWLQQKVHFYAQTSSNVHLLCYTDSVHYSQHNESTDQGPRFVLSSCIVRKLSAEIQLKVARTLAYRGMRAARGEFVVGWNHDIRVVIVYLSLRDGQLDLGVGQYPPHILTLCNRGVN
jgi:hypothetical protein